MIDFTGPWREPEKQIALAAIERLSKELIELSGYPDAFERLIPKLTLEAVYKLPGLWCGLVEVGKPDRIKLKIGCVTESIVLHELGHVINDLVPNKDRPATYLARHGIFTLEGVPVTGPGRRWYERWFGYRAPRNGYKSDLVHIHPRWRWKGNNELEDFADMLLAWALDNFTDDPKGQALLGWITNYLRERIQNDISRI